MVKVTDSPIEKAERGRLYCEVEMKKARRRQEKACSALEEIAALACTTHLIQGHMFRTADPRQIAREALASLSDEDDAVAATFAADLAALDEKGED